MNKRKICLFTAHSPQTGGGGVILRSLVSNLSDLSISWYYIGDREIKGYENGYLGKALMGGELIKDVVQTWKLLVNEKTPFIENLVNQLMAIDCDGYWIVSHNEGLRLAVELAGRQSRPVHLTVHDDWAGALCARSVRYRLMGRVAKKLTINALKTVSSFDVVSVGMKNYYEKLSGKTGEICHRYLPEGSIHTGRGFSNSGQSEILAGHIGSIYDKNDFIAFLSMFHEFGIAKGKKAMLQMWGCHLNINEIPVHLRDSILFFDTLPEEQVIPMLARCTFVYAMYPLSSALRVFSKTSLPTKLTSYLQAGRPIFGHGPKDSTLACFIDTNSLGVMWHSRKKEDGFKCLEKILTENIGLKQFENARIQYFGKENLTTMRRVLLDSANDV